MLTGDQTLLLIVAGLALFGVLLGLWQLQVARKLRRDIEALRQQRTEPVAAKKPTPANFSTSLDAIERQQLQAVQSVPPAKSVDKYSYVGSLAEQGLDAKGIAAALQMPVAEVEQLLRLAKLKQPAV